MNSNLKTSVLTHGLRDGIEDLAGDVVYARRNEDLGRLALLCYCEIRRWARIAGEQRLAELCCSLVAQQSAGNRSEFLQRVDGVIAELDKVGQSAGLNLGLRQEISGTDSAS